MKKYILIYTETEEAMKKMGTMSPEEQKKGMDGWKAWADNLGDQMLEIGTPFGPGLKLPEGTPAHGLMGYSVLQAENMDGAKKLLDDYPYQEGMGHELYEAMPMPG